MIRWDEGASFSVFDVRSSLGQIVDALGVHESTWVVLGDRERPGSTFYAFRPAEVRDAATRLGYDAELTIALGQPLAMAPALTVGVLGQTLAGGPGATRAVKLDASGQIRAVGEVVPAMNKFTGDSSIVVGEVSRPNIASASREVSLQEPVDCVLSADAPALLAVGAEALVEVRLELAAGALPFLKRVPATLAPDVEVTALLFANPPDRVERLDPILRLEPPGERAPSHDAFVVRGVKPGEVELRVMFRQGGSPLGSLVLRSVVSAQASDPLVRSTARVMADQRDTLQERGLVLLVEERRAGDEIRYRYRVHSSALQLNYDAYDSEPFFDAAGRAATPFSYVRGVYKRLEERALRNLDDAALFARELRGLGTDLCRQLLPPKLVELLWEHRDRIEHIEVNASEPYVPWELLRLRHPGTREVDERFLAGYGLVRTFAGRMGRQALPRDRWAVMVGDYEGGASAPVGGERRWMLETLARRGLAARELPPEPMVLLDAVRDGSFDVLHLAVHATADLKDISSSSLVLSEREGRQVSVDSRTIDGEAGKWATAPVVFLNACQSGRQSPVLSGWGGWAQTFWAAGAGVFVGTSWAVRDKPATIFAEGFYSALLDGKPLVEATRVARAQAAQRPDASWLAFSVWGRPSAAMAPAPEPVSH